MFRKFQVLILVLCSSILYASEGWRHQVVLTNNSCHVVRAVAAILDNDGDYDPEYIVSSFSVASGVTKLIPIEINKKAHFKICLVGKPSEDERQRRLINRAEGESLIKRAQDMENEENQRRANVAFMPFLDWCINGSQPGFEYDCGSSEDTNQVDLSVLKRDIRRGQALIESSQYESTCEYTFNPVRVEKDDFGVRLTIFDRESEHVGGIFLSAKNCHLIKNKNMIGNIPRFLALVSVDKYIPGPAYLPPSSKYAKCSKIVHISELSELNNLILTAHKVHGVDKRECGSTKSNYVHARKNDQHNHGQYWEMSYSNDQTRSLVAALSCYKNPYFNELSGFLLCGRKFFDQDSRDYKSRWPYLTNAESVDHHGKRTMWLFSLISEDTVQIVHQESGYVLAVDKKHQDIRDEFSYRVHLCDPEDVDIKKTSIWKLVPADD